MARKWSTILIGFKASLLVIVSLISVFARGEQLAFEADTSPSLPVQLKLGQAVQADLLGGQAHSYVVALEAGQYMRVVVSHTPPPIAVRLSSVNGRQPLLNLTLQGPTARLEPISWIAKASGKYRLELEALGKSTAPQVVVVELAELRSDLPDDQQRLLAQELLNQARAMIWKGGAQEAIQILERTLSLSRATKDQEREAIELTTLGFIYASLGQHEKAIGPLQQALAIWRAIKDRSDESNTLLNLGFAYSGLKEYEKEIGSVEEALSIKREAGDHKGEAQILYLLGTAYSSAKKHEKAIAYLDQALRIERTAMDQKAEEATLNALGYAYFELNKYEEAVGDYKQLVTMKRETGDQQGEATVFNNLGAAFAALSHYDDASEYYKQALTLSQKIGDSKEQAKALTGLGDVQLSLQQYQKAIDYYSQSLAINDDQVLESSTLGNQGLAYSSLGQYGQALTCLIRAEAIASVLKDERRDGVFLSDLGTTYYYLGEKMKAIGFFERSLAITRKTGDRRREGLLLSYLGNAYFGLTAFKKSRDLDEESLAIARETKDQKLEATELDALAHGYYLLKQYDKAIDYETQSLEISREADDHGQQAVTLTNLGTEYRLMGQYEKAIKYYQQALALEREVKDHRVEAVAFTQLMEAEAASGKPRLAIFYGKQAVNDIQAIRSDILELVPELQVSFLNSNDLPYHLLAELLIQEGRLTEAEQVLTLLKEQEYLDFVRRDSDEVAASTRKADPTPDEAEWQKRYAEIGGKLVALGVARGELLNKKDLAPEETKRMAQLDQAIALGNVAFEKFLDDLAAHFTMVTGATGKVEQLREAQGLMEDLHELPKGTVAIYTIVGTDKYRSILVTPDVQKAYEYSITAADLNRKILIFRQALENPELDPRPMGQELYNVLVANLAEDLRQAKATTVMWSLDGALRYLPLAALYDGKQYLVEQYALSVFTPASNARLKDRPDVEWKAAGFGVTKAHENAPALPGVASELSGIIERNEGEGGILVGEIKLDDQFTENAMRQTLLKRYSVVHIASHFRFQPGDETNSFLLLGDGNHLSLAQLKSLPNLFGGVQLLTLSACNTGVGDTNGEGKEVEGLGVLAQRKGAKAVVASLWPVADVSTSLLMREFYRIRQVSKTTKLEALREAQLGLLRGKMNIGNASSSSRELLQTETSASAPQARSFKFDAKAPFAHPYYWAPFFLMGNWL